jgi:hypothetical protein
MKKIVFCVIGLSVVLFLVVSCQFTPVSDESSEKFQISAEIDALLQKTSVRLVDGVEESDLGLSYENWVSKLSSDLSKKHGRSVNGNDKIDIDIESMAGIIENQFEKIFIPELLEPTAEDIALINQVFPDLTEEEIVKNLEAIQIMYQEQLGVLATKAFITHDYELITPDVGRAAGYSNGTFYFEDEKLTVQEIAAMAKHALSAVTLYNQKNLAQDLTKKYMGSKDRVNDKSDAFRHSIFSVVLAVEGYGLKNERMAWAKDFSTAHEQGAKYVAVESEMDLHNNNVGLRYFDSNSSKKYTKILLWSVETGVSMPSYSTACTALKTKAKIASLVDKNKVNQSSAISSINKIGSDTLVYIKEDNNSYP